MLALVMGWIILVLLPKSEMISSDGSCQNLGPRACKFSRKGLSMIDMNLAGNLPVEPVERLTPTVSHLDHSA